MLKIGGKMWRLDEVMLTSVKAQICVKKGIAPTKCR